ncbi:MAG: DNA polymerase/3'-5' exonuclease PolX [Nitrososphaerales archaeon]
MKNSLVAQILEQLADYSEMEDDQPYRARAYRRAAQTIESMREDVLDLWKQKKLQDLPGVGENIEKKIDEILRTGKLETLEKMKQRTPVDVGSLTKIEGIGPKTVKELNRQLGIHNVDEFEAAVKEGKLQNFRGLGVKTSEQLLERIQNARAQSSRVLLVKGILLADRVLDHVSKIPNVKRYVAAGSLRRMKDTTGDLDILIETDDPIEAIDYFTKGDEVREVSLKGDLKASVKIENNFQVDVRVIPQRSWGAALLYFTGSKQHNIELRTIAIRKGLRLNEYGLFRGEDNMVAGDTEQAVYSALGLDYVEPELRENRGEIQAASLHTLPKLVTVKDVRGDLQMHTEWSDGHDSVEVMAEASKKLGYEYIAITDHIGSLKVANALDESRIKEQRKVIEKLNKKYESAGDNFHVLQGAEVNIKADGELDMKDIVLKEFDLVLAAIHSGFKDDLQKITVRISGALENENVDILAHPTGRLLLERSGYPFDVATIIDRAIETETVLEIDGHPNRLDLSDENALAAIRAGCTLSIDTDSHESAELEYMKLGISQARRAWAENKNILNTRSYKDLLRYLQS